MKRLISFLAISIVLSLLISCSDDDNNGSSNTVFKATLTGAKEVPPNASTATGNAVLTFNNSTNKFTLTVSYSGITPSMGHVHKGAVGVSGPVVFPFIITASPINFTSDALDASEEADLKNNLYYVNLHTDAFPDGEIRGQLIKQQLSSGGGGNNNGGGGGYGY